MSFSESSMKIINQQNCPLYEMGDEFRLLDKAILALYGKPICLMLAGDVADFLKKYENTDDHNTYVFGCGGCGGSVQIEFRKMKKGAISASVNMQNNYIGALVSLLGNFSVFKSFDEEDIKDLASFLRVDKFEKGEYILKKGEEGQRLFIIISGKVEVLGDGDVRIAYLEKGEIFGEISLLSGGPVTATIKVMEPANVLYLNGEYFRNLLSKFPPLQIYLARLVARRLAKMNLMKSEDLLSGMAGKLSEIPPSGLFQTLNLNQKTGIVMLELPGGQGDISFRDGEVVAAKYNEKQGREAFCELLKAKGGRFKFMAGLPPEKMNIPVLGDFMGLLMDGIRRIDEENE